MCTPNLQSPDCYSFTLIKAQYQFEEDGERAICLIPHDLPCQVLHSCMCNITISYIINLLHCIHWEWHSALCIINNYVLILSLYSYKVFIGNGIWFPMFYCELHCMSLSCIHNFLMPLWLYYFLSFQLITYKLSKKNRYIIFIYSKALNVQVNVFNRSCMLVNGIVPEKKKIFI